MTGTDIENHGMGGTMPTSIMPWCSVQNAFKAVEFYKAAFGAIETYRLEIPDGSLIVRLSVNGAEFWVSGGSDGNEGLTAEMLGGGSVRMILNVANPEALFDQALRAGATKIFPVGVDHGWKLGRLADPLGLHWEIGHPVDAGGE